MGYASGRTPSRPVLWNPEIVESSLPGSPWSVWLELCFRFPLRFLDYSALLYQQLHFLRNERTCHLTIGFHPNSVSSIQDEAWTTYANCLLSNIEPLLIEKCLGGIPRTSEHDPSQFLWHESCSLAPCKYFWGSTRNPFLLAYCRIFRIDTWAPARCGR